MDTIISLAQGNEKDVPSPDTDIDEGDHLQSINYHNSVQTSSQDRENSSLFVTSSVEKVSTSKTKTLEKTASGETLDQLEKQKSYIKILNKFKNDIQRLKSDVRKGEGNIYLTSYVKTLFEIANVFSLIDDENREELATSGVSAVTVLCDIAVDIYNSGFQMDNGDIVANNFAVLDRSLSALTDFSNSYQAGTQIICDHPRFLECAAIYLSNMKDKNSCDDKEATIIVATLCVIHNVASFDDNVSKLRSLGYIEVLSPYLERAPVEIARLIAIASIADIVNEEECVILQKGQNILSFLAEVLKVAMTEDNRIHPAYSVPVTELLKITRNIAKNDNNKKALIDHGFLPLLVETSGAKELCEQREAIRTLWTLSFDKDIQRKMISDTSVGVVEIFVANRESADKEIAESSKGALWTMREELSKSNKYKHLYKEKSNKEKDTPVTENDRGHVMLSYQWSNQKVMIKIRDYLRSKGFRVWMDIDDMSGSTLESMAHAVEKAKMVMVCYSKKYKESDNCRAEAEYAFQRKKPVIPLRMQEGYRADGWLGFIIGAKLFYDFSGKYPFELKIESLVRELQKMLTVNEEVIPESSQVVHQVKVTSTSPGNDVKMSSRMNVKLWTPTQVGQWLDKHGLDKSKFGNLQGVEIAFMQYLFEKSPDYFNKAMIENLKIDDLLTMAKFTFALEDTKID